jgi:AraC-like DNA-binding protein
VQHAVDPPGIPSQTRWVLPNGFGGVELSPETVAFPQDIGRISRIQHRLGPGLELYTYAAAFTSPLTMSYEVLTGKPYFWLAVSLSGGSEFHHGTTMNGVAAGGRSHFAMLRDPVTRLTYVPSVHRGAGMAVSPDRLGEMLHGQRLCRSIDDFIDGRFDPWIASSTITPTFLRVASQICENPYHGVLGSVFLEAKAFELLAEFLSGLVDDRHSADTGKRRYALTARDIIMADLANPPRIADLAHQVGLSQRRLNEIFHDEFDGSPLQCLVRWRLDMARQLLANSELTVKQVAHMAGYAHVSNFSLAFSRRFGHPPSGVPEDEEASASRSTNRRRGYVGARTDETSDRTEGDHQSDVRSGPRR